MVSARRPLDRREKGREIRKRGGYRRQRWVSIAIAFVSVTRERGGGLEILGRRRSFSLARPSGPPRIYVPEVAANALRDASVAARRGEKRRTLRPSLGWSSQRGARDPRTRYGLSSIHVCFMHTISIEILLRLVLLWRSPSAQSGGMWYSMICLDVNPGICR